MKIPLSSTGKCSRGKSVFTTALTLAFLASLLICLTPSQARSLFAGYSSIGGSTSGHSYNRSSGYSPRSSSAFINYGTGGGVDAWSNMGQGFTGGNESFFWGNNHQQSPSLFDPRYWSNDWVNSKPELVSQVQRDQQAYLTSLQDHLEYYQQQQQYYEELQKKREARMRESAKPLEGNIQEWHESEAETAPVPVVKLMYSIEERLIWLHDHDEIGSFDIDEFTKRLLEIKKNYATMIEKTSSLSPNQDYALRVELAGLAKEIRSRI